MFFPKEGMKTAWRFKEKILLPYSDDSTNAMLPSRVAPNQVDSLASHPTTAHSWPANKVTKTLGHVKGYWVVAHDFIWL